MTAMDWLCRSFLSDPEHPLIITQPVPVPVVVRYDPAHFLPEEVRVIRLVHVNKFVNNHVIDHFWWGKDKAPAEGEGS